MGASAVIVFIIPSSPLAQPWPLVGGQLVSVVVGVACAQAISDTVFASACAVGGSVLAMLLLRCLHPPGAASALAPVLSGNTVTTLGYSYVLMPVGLNIAVMLMLAIVINRWLFHYDYPSNQKPLQGRATGDGDPSQSQNRGGISGQDLQKALLNRDSFMDVSPHELEQLLADAQKYRVERIGAEVTCGDIMVGNVLTVEYGTEVEMAWRIMQREKLKALPVIDRAGRVIGIISWYDFFKFINVTESGSFAQKLRHFIRRTADTSADKPEAVGHIMAAPVMTLAETSPISGLIPLMSAHGYRQIPIVNNENRLVGMVYQADLIEALYRQSFTFEVKN